MACALGRRACPVPYDATTLAPMTLTHLTSMMIQRATMGFVVASAIAFIASRTHALSRGGAVAAAVVGTAAVAASWNWGALLIVYFVVSSLLSRVGRARKEQLTSGVVAKSDARDATQ